MIKSIESMIDYDKNIKYVTIDMDRGYRGVVPTFYHVNDLSFTTVANGEKAFEWFKNQL